MGDDAELLTTQDDTTSSAEKAGVGCLGHSHSGPRPYGQRSTKMWLGIVALIIWIALAFWPARVARRKGHSFFGYFLLSLLFFPLALILAYVVGDRRALVVV
jgi:hypothetical protein